MKGIILHGGRGTRLRPLTHTGPKQLIPVANKPISQYGLENLRDAGVKEIAIILGDVAPERVVECYGDGQRFDVKITYVKQGDPKGIAHAVQLCEDFVGNESFIVYLGDNILKGGIIGFANTFQGSEFDSMVLLCKVKDPQRFGVAGFNEGKLVRLVEKPKEPPSDYALVGIYFFKPVIFKAIRQLKLSWRGELEITEAIQTLMDWGLNVGYDFVSEWWKDTGRPEDILEANQFFLTDVEPSNLGTVEEGVTLDGKVSIDRGTIIRRGSTIRGPVIIGKNCEIGPEAYIGPYTSIGDGVVIRGGEVENSIIMNNSTIECRRRIVDSLIGGYSKINSSGKSLPTGCRLVIGENTLLSL